jgi:hypothetical protein
MPMTRPEPPDILRSLSATSRIAEAGEIRLVDECLAEISLKKVSCLQHLGERARFGLGARKSLLLHPFSQTLGLIAPSLIGFRSPGTQGRDSYRKRGLNGTAAPKALAGPPVGA